MTRLTLTPNDIHPLLEGLAIMGTGGGGSPVWGRMILEQDVRMGRAWPIIAPEDVPDDATVVSGSMMGADRALEAIGFENVLQHWETHFPLLDATRVMARLLNRPIDALVSIGAGALNTAVILSLGARTGIPVVDGDALGRSAPETSMTSFIGHGIDIAPMPVVDHYGNVVIVQEAETPTYPDQIARFVVNQGGAMGASSHYPMTGAQLRQAVIPHTLTQAVQLGRRVWVARQQGSDPLAAAAETMGCHESFYGCVTALREELQLGVYFTTVTLEGQEKDAGWQAELVIKNETLLFKIQGEIVCMFPDMVVMLEPHTGRGLMSAELHTGMEVVLLAMPCHPRLQAAAMSEIGRVAMGPARFGHPDLIYQPMH